MSDIRLTAMSKSLAKTYRVFQHSPSDDRPFLRGKGETGHRLLCSRCGFTMGERVEDLEVLLGAVAACKGCGVHLNLGKQSRYSARVAMEGDPQGVEGRGIPINADWMAFVEDWVGMTKLSGQLLEGQREYERQRPAVLHHYTTRAGLLGIVESGKVWASDVAFMNDASELKYGNEVLNEVLDHGRWSERAGLADLIGFATSQPLDPLSAAFNQYVVCFCEDGDLLSQWRSYGAGGGCSLGFYTPHLEPFDIRRMVYDPATQRQIVTDIIVGVVNNFEASMRGQSSEAQQKTQLGHVQFLSAMLSAVLPTFKHPAFREEREWRLIRTSRRDRQGDILQFRQAGQFLLPYLALALNDRQTLVPPLPLVSIKCGPSNDRDLITKSAHQLLEKFGYDHVEVTGSAAPLRS